MSHFDLSALTAPLTTKAGLTHAVLQSLCNHSESTENDRARMQNTERGGCWSNEFINNVGSRHWTLQREKNTEQTITRIKRFNEEALAWLVTEKHIKAVTVDVVKLSPTKLGREIKLTLNDGTTLKVTP